MIRVVATFKARVDDGNVQVVGNHEAPGRQKETRKSNVIVAVVQ